MTARLSPQRETEIRERANAATPGPWGTYEYAHGGSLIDIAAGLADTGTGYTARRGVARLDAEPLDNDPSHREWTEEEDWAQVQADAEFTAHAREDVPALLAELAAVRAQVDEVQGKYAVHVSQLIGERDEAHALVRELEPLAVERERDDIRRSFTEQIAQARQARDREAAWKAECELSDYEAEWRRVDEEAAR